MDPTLSSYLFYAFAAALGFAALVRYLRKHGGEASPALVAFMLFGAVNFSSDGVSKAWFATWRIIDKPPGMVDHVLVDVVTYSAAFAIIGAVWFWTRAEFGHWFAIKWGGCGLTAALLLPLI